MQTKLYNARTIGLVGRVRYRNLATILKRPSNEPNTKIRQDSETHFTLENVDRGAASTLGSPPKSWECRDQKFR
jgi:hypothetical protein